MDTKIIHHFLRQIAANNNREWFLAHKQQYLESKTEFEAGIAEAIARIATFDEEISHLQVKDCTYRFYRDIRFSPDKSPYKRHFGAYICAKGKKALRGGYYIHVEPGNSLKSCQTSMNGEKLSRTKNLSNISDKPGMAYGKKPTRASGWRA